MNRDNVIQTEFTALDVMLRRIRQKNPKTVVIVYEFENEDGETTIRVNYLEGDRTRLVGMLSGAAQDIWNAGETAERGVGPGDVV